MKRKITHTLSTPSAGCWWSPWGPTSGCPEAGNTATQSAINICLLAERSQPKHSTNVRERVNGAHCAQQSIVNSVHKFGVQPRIFSRVERPICFSLGRRERGGQEGRKTAEVQQKRRNQGYRNTFRGNLKKKLQFPTQLDAWLRLHHFYPILQNPWKCTWLQSGREH